MHVTSSLALLTILGIQLTAQTPATPPVSTFDLHLDQRANAPVSVSAVVARDTHLYFSVSSSAGSQVVQTSVNGIVESSQSFPFQQLTGFDLADSGGMFAMLDRSRVVEYDSQWNVLHTQRMQSEVDAFAVVGGTPVGISPDNDLAFLHAQDGTRKHAFTLKAYPGPWRLFAIGPDRLAILQTQTGSLHVVQVDGDWSTHTAGHACVGSEPALAAATPDGRIFTVEPVATNRFAQIVQRDDHGTARFQFRYELPSGFRPRMIAVSGSHIVLADAQGKVALYALESNPSPSQSVDSWPELLSDTEPFKATVRQAAYTGAVMLSVDIRADGSVEHAELKSPLALDAIPGLMNIVRAWRFRPAVHAGQPAADHMEINFLF